MSIARPLITSLALTLVAGAAAVPAAHAGLDSGVPVGQLIHADERVERVVRGNLDCDGIRDAVVVTRKRARNDSGGHDRRLVFLRGVRRGRYVDLDYGSRTGVGASGRVLQCTTCGGAFFGTRTAPVHVSIRRGTVVVRQRSGSRELLDQTFRLRMRTRLVSAQGGRMPRTSVRLIGYDDVLRDRATGTSTSRSWNLLTGRTLVRDRDAQGTVTRSETGERRRAPIALERLVPATLWP